MLKKLIILILFLLTIVSYTSNVLAYSPKTTHAALTQEIIDFYNLLHPESEITEEEKEWIIEGSILEDREVRAINHLYDPVYKIGWTGDKVGKFSAEAVENFTSVFVAPVEPTHTVRWVNDRILQSRYGSYGGDRTWKQALEYWADGNKKEAYITLGHVIHLLEDMSVPDHTRNDPHPPIGGEFGSPYEAYADSKWSRDTIKSLDIPNKLKSENVVVPKFNSIEEYLISLAEYSNKYFFSKDTINDPDYDFPKIIREDSNFGYGIDEDGGELPLVKIKREVSNEGLIIRNYVLDISNESILDSYFSRLAEKSVLYGAGVIKLFYQQAADAEVAKDFPVRLVKLDKTNPIVKTFTSSYSLFGELLKAWNKTKSFLANVGSNISNLFNVREVEVAEFNQTTATEDNEITEQFNEQVSEVSDSQKPPQVAVDDFRSKLDDVYDQATEVDEQIKALVSEEKEKGVESSVSQSAEDEKPPVVLASNITSNSGGSIFNADPENSTSEEPNSENNDEDEGKDESVTVPTEEINNIDYVVISEVQVAGIDAGDEFIELYNPTANTFDISGWSIQYVSGSAAEVSSSTVSKKNFLDTNSIPANGFFLIARNLNTEDKDGYTGSTLSDMGHRTFSLSGASAGAKIFLVSNQDKIESVNDPDIIDFIDYSFTVPPASSSLERKALDSNVCVSAQNVGEFLGNGCDTDSDSDFEIREFSKPQNSENLPEPRSAPVAPTATLDYDSEALALSFVWQPVQDSTGSTSTVIYEIQEFSSPGAVIFSEAGSQSFQKTIDEVGRDYNFSIQSFDRDGLGSASTSLPINVPSFLDELYFYQDPRDPNTDYLLEFYYNNYPFVPDLYWDPPDNSWKILVFYLNKEAVKEDLLNTASAWNPVETEDIFSVKIEECAGANTTVKRIILPDTKDRCGLGGGLNNNAFVFSKLEDNHLLFKSASSTNDIILSEEDYITVAFYSFYAAGGGNQSLKLAAVDKLKYYFQTDVPEHSAPTTLANLAVSSYTVNSPTSTVTLSWDPSTDADTLDSVISYEWSLDEVVWESLGINISLALGDDYNIFVRAVDDFENYSENETLSFSLPSPVIDLSSDPSNNYFAVDGVKLENNLLKIKWRLISNPAPNGVFGIIPYLTEVGAPTNATISSLRTLHRDYGGNTSYPNTTANSSGQCNAAITPTSQYTLGWQYETQFSSISGTAISDDLLGKELQFALYATDATPGMANSTCNLSDVVDNPLFTGLPITTSN